MNNLFLLSTVSKLKRYTNDRVVAKFRELSGKEQQDSEVIDARQGEISLSANLAKIKKDLENIIDTRMVYDLSKSPGHKQLIAGDREAGFFDFVSSDDFITGSALASAVGISQGALQESDTPWIKYMYDGKVCFTPLKTIRHSITHDAIYNAGCVYGTEDEGFLPPTGRSGVKLSIDATDNSINGSSLYFLGDKSEAQGYADTVGAVGDTLVLKGWSNGANSGEVIIDSITQDKIVVTGKTLVTEQGKAKSRIYNAAKKVTQNKKVTIGDVQYRCRLFKGANENPTNKFSNTDGGGRGKGNEWNWIILQLHEHAKLKNWIYPAYVDTDLGDFKIYLTDEDLRTHNSFGYGSYSWCQEVRDDMPWRRVYRGGHGASNLHANNSWVVLTNIGWRPVLEVL